MIEDEPGAPPQEDTLRAVQLHSELLAFAGAKQDLSAADPALLSFYLAGSLPLDLDFKQKLLSLRSEPERLSLFITSLQTIIPNLHRTARAREKAGGKTGTCIEIRLRVGRSREPDAGFSPLFRV
jgi:hypothetical protein